ncbi:MAG: agmatine deiminase family protein [Acidobacteriia bacterium]|nr:agmatine deiminase family protein [Terriglobia bacterium]
MTKRESSSTQQPAANLRMPAEWEPHAATWMAWPHYRDDWPGKFEPIPWVYAEIIRNLARHERVQLIVNDAASERRARKVLERANAFSDNVCFHRWPTNRVWTRDSGCTFVTCSTPDLTRKNREGHDFSRADMAPLRDRALAPEGELLAVKWRFNAWAKYPNWQHDEKIGSHMAKAAGTRELRPAFGKYRVVLEGGSIDVNGQGALLTTEECLLSKVQQRNPAMSRADYEKVLAEYLGIKSVIWLGAGIVGDDTHGHVDDLTRFVAPDTVVTVVESDPDDPNYEPLRENIRRLRAATDQDGKSLAIIELPMPAPVIFEGRRLPASYGNFYIANGVVLVPVFNDPNDRFALDILADLFPDRDVIGIYSGDLIWGFGAMHCMTQQQPAV